MTPRKTGKTASSTDNVTALRVCVSGAVSGSAVSGIFLSSSRGARFGGVKSIMGMHDEPRAV